MAWLSGWDKRVKLTIDNTDIDGILSNFPVLLYISESSGRNSDDISCVFDELISDDNRKKIAVTTSDGETKCYVEIEKWDDANEQAWLWVKVPSIASDADTDLYLYYDKDHADNTDYVGDPNSTPAENVWDSDFKFVSHMRDDPDTSHIRDSTNNDNDGIKKGAAEPAVTTAGKVGKAQNFDGIDDKIAIPGLNGWTPSNGLTAEVLVKLDSISKDSLVFQKNSGNTEQYHISAYSNNIRASIKHSGSYYEPSTAGETGVWHYYATTYDNETVILYDQGANVAQNTDPSGALTALNVDAEIGRVMGDNSWCVDGIIDEVRISDVARSAAWIKASYESERDDLLDWGDEETTGTIVTPGKVDLTLTPYPPILKLKITPSTLEMSDTEYAPVLKFGIIPSLLSLDLTGYTPILKEVLTPSKLDLTLTKYAPTITFTGDIVITPSTLDSIITSYIPSIGITANVTVVPSTLSQALTLYNPSIIVGGNVEVIPSTLALALTPYIPTILQALSVSDTGEGSEAVSLLVDTLLREMLGVLEGLSVEITPEAVAETGVGTDVVRVDKQQIYRMSSDIRPLYAIISIIRGRYEMLPTVRELYKFQTRVRGG